MLYLDTSVLVAATTNEPRTIDVLAWVDLHRRTGGACRAVAMRDSDRDRVTHILARRGRGIEKLAVDPAGRWLIAVGSRGVWRWDQRLQLLDVTATVYRSKRVSGVDRVLDDFACRAAEEIGQGARANVASVRHSQTHQNSERISLRMESL